MSKTIELAVTEFLESVGVKFSVSLVGATKREDWECDEWRVNVKSTRIDFITQFFTGTGHRVDTTATKLARVSLAKVSRDSITWHEMLKGMKAKAPSAAAVFSSLVSDGRAINQSFLDWCDEFGADTDSRKALATYEACGETGRKLRKVFTCAQLEQLEKLLQDY